jgi:5-methylcytosine-specific restriction enzyme A
VRLGGTLKITEEAVHRIYELSVQVYIGDLKQSEALKSIDKSKFMAKGSATNYIGNFKCMMRGIGYKRAMNKYSTEYFLRSIRQDFGHERFLQGLTATSFHLDYYHTLDNGHQKGISELVDSLRGEFNVSDRTNGLYPEESDEIKYIEGAVKAVIVNAYERNSQARRKCIEFYGLNCVVCGFNFAEFYGDLGIGFIHVHHVLDIAVIGSEYVVDPIKDLVPVCANCHAMLHKTKPALQISELKKLLKPAA